MRWLPQLSGKRLNNCIEVKFYSYVGPRLLTWAFEPTLGYTVVRIMFDLHTQRSLKATDSNSKALAAPTGPKWIIRLRERITALGNRAQLIEARPQPKIGSGADSHPSPCRPVPVGPPVEGFFRRLAFGSHSALLFWIYPSGSHL
jgi:hypothetical protein